MRTSVDSSDCVCPAPPRPLSTHAPFGENETKQQQSPDSTQTYRNDMKTGHCLNGSRLASATLPDTDTNVSVEYACVDVWLWMQTKTAKGTKRIETNGETLPAYKTKEEKNWELKTKKAHTDTHTHREINDKDLSK